MVLLKYITVIGCDGGTTVNVGLPKSQIIAVSRQGEEKDWMGPFLLSAFNGSNWAVVLGRPHRITFGANYPFVGDEVIHIIYKVTV
jgi:hypothetical protein